MFSFGVVLSDPERARVSPKESQSESQNLDRGLAPSLQALLSAQEPLCCSSATPPGGFSAGQ